MGGPDRPGPRCAPSWGATRLDETLSETETINRNIREILVVQTED